MKESGLVHISCFSYENVIKISPKLRLDVLIKKKVCIKEAHTVTDKLEEGHVT